MLAAGAGLLSGLALIAGAALAWYVKVSPWVIAAITAFGAGVLISALAFDLVAEATQVGGLATSMAGFLGGAVLYVGLDGWLEHRGARRKRRHDRAAASGSGVGIALGALLDGIPETAVQGVQLAGGGALPVGVLVAVMISNIPEGLSSTADMKAEGRGAGYVFGVWGVITAACTASALACYALLGAAPAGVQSVVTAVAAGAILAMLANTMLPDAFRRTHTLTGLITALGFFASYYIHQVSS